MDAARRAEGPDLEPAGIRLAQCQPQFLRHLDVKGPLVLEVLRERQSQRHADQEHIARLRGNHHRHPGRLRLVETRHGGREVVQGDPPRTIHCPDAKTHRVREGTVVVRRREQIHRRIVGDRNLEHRPPWVARLFGPLVIGRIVTARILLPVGPAGGFQKEIVHTVPSNQIERDATDRDVLLREPSARPMMRMPVETHGNVDPGRGNHSLPGLHHVGGMNCSAGRPDGNDDGEAPGFHAGQ